MFKLKHHTGINLIEFLLTLSIIGILAIISIPSFIDFIKNHRLTGVAENLYYDLQSARTEALKRNQDIYVSFNVGDNWCYGINPNSSCDCTVANSCSLGTTTASASGLISLSQSGLSNNVLIFDKTRGVANASGSITLTLFQKSTAITLKIGKLGYLQMCSNQLSEYDSC